MSEIGNILRGSPDFAREIFPSRTSTPGSLLVKHHEGYMKKVRSHFGSRRSITSTNDGAFEGCQVYCCCCLFFIKHWKIWNLIMKWNFLNLIFKVIKDRRDKTLLLMNNLLVFLGTQFSTWVACLGFTLGFGGMFLKTWRVHKIFLNRTKKMVSERKSLFPCKEFWGTDFV